ncbi:unnamed protein product, partial [Tenebrio molitor]
ATNNIAVELRLSIFAMTNVLFTLNFDTYNAVKKKLNAQVSFLVFQIFFENDTSLLIFNSVQYPKIPNLQKNFISNNKCRSWRSFQS